MKLTAFLFMFTTMCFAAYWANHNDICKTLFWSMLSIMSRDNWIRIAKGER